jgi:hypothetical protein
VLSQHNAAIAISGGLYRQGLGFEFLGVAFGKSEFAFQGDDLGRAQAAGADEIPERGFSGTGGDADAGRAAVDVVGLKRVTD